MRMRTATVALLLALWAPFGFAHDYSQGPIKIDHPWSRPTPPGTPMGVGYLAITNSGESAITLTAAETPRAARVSLHESSMKDGVMRMQPLKDGLAIPAGATVELKPHGYHLMLEKLKTPLVEGERIPVTLRFDGAEAMDIELTVEPLDGGMQKQDMKMDHTGHDME
ncbi:metal-binding protein [Marinobacter salinus]|uniref:Metal-binding protein n=1 Tax=Marinobacter salinus TaxID=1874317 RepID=A0A1D9GLE2_9GAMM|nr:copper chaperone PCu(A)C [Marinobacter salinus]AOY88457.1 metal-binding protein [Marinobacter salinus]